LSIYCSLPLRLNYHARHYYVHVPRAVINQTVCLFSTAERRGLGGPGGAEDGRRPPRPRPRWLSVKGRAGWGDGCPWFSDSLPPLDPYGTVGFHVTDSLTPSFSPGCDQTTHTPPPLTYKHASRVAFRCIHPCTPPRLHFVVGWPPIRGSPTRPLGGGVGQALPWGPKNKLGPPFSLFAKS